MAVRAMQAGTTAAAKAAAREVHSAPSGATRRTRIAAAWTATEEKDGPAAAAANTFNMGTLTLAPGSRPPSHQSCFSNGALLPLWLAAPQAILGHQASRHPAPQARANPSRHLRTLGVTAEAGRTAPHAAAGMTGQTVGTDMNAPADVNVNGAWTADLGRVRPIERQAAPT